MIWQTSTDNSTWTDMATPSSFKIDWEDLDSNSYRSCTNGNLTRNVIKRRWAKVSMSWNLVSESVADTILKAVNKETVYFRFKTPAFGTSDFFSFKGYVSKMQTEKLEANVGWTLSFNVIQSTSASFQ